LPPLSRVGAGVVVAGLLVDLVAHLGPGPESALATAAHVLVLAGMVLALVGAISLGLRTGSPMKEGRYR
jgi:hypothetical protein